MADSAAMRKSATSCAACAAANASSPTGAAAAVVSPAGGTAAGAGTDSGLTGAGALGTFVLTGKISPALLKNLPMPLPTLEIKFGLLVIAASAVAPRINPVGLFSKSLLLAPGGVTCLTPVSVLVAPGVLTT